jgi:hypothetical protein
VSDPSPKSHIIFSGNQSNSAENCTSFHTGACLDGCETDDISTFISLFFTLSFGQFITEVIHHLVTILTFGWNIQFSLA